MKSPYLIQGNKHIDERGVISFVNDFNLENVVRFYTILHEDISIIRAWQGHKFETKYFYCLKGRFIINLVKIDDWDSPTIDLSVDTFILEEGISQVLFVPPGYANGFKATLKNSHLLVFSDKTVKDSLGDDYRFDKDNWFNWEKV